MGPSDLEQIINSLPPLSDKRVRSGVKEDATVYELNSSLAVVQTVDFITPVLNDPYAFGAVAASNALSDIYATGAQPLFALNIVEFPVKSLPLKILQEILRGGSDKAKEAGISITGGHSLEDNAPKYGLSVTGVVDPSRIVQKKGAQPGDLLFLTKPLGTGIITTAISLELAGVELEKEVYMTMAHLNRGASAAMTSVGVHACTDITGFGLLGHLSEMLEASGVSAQLHTSQVPVMPGTREMAGAGAVPAGAHQNYRFVRDKIKGTEKASPVETILLADPQTAGGLLMAVAQDKAGELQKALEDAKCPAAAQIGKITERQDNLIQLLA